MTCGEQHKSSRQSLSLSLYLEVERLDERSLAERLRVADAPHLDVKPRGKQVCLTNLIFF